jgi:hypothetical protein
MEWCRSSIHYAFYELPELEPVPIILEALKGLSPSLTGARA